jgi:hypothetical protein
MMRFPLLRLVTFVFFYVHLMYVTFLNYLCSARTVLSVTARHGSSMPMGTSDPTPSSPTSSAPTTATSKAHASKDGRVHSISLSFVLTMSARGSFFLLPSKFERFSSFLSSSKKHTVDASALLPSKEPRVSTTPPALPPSLLSATSPATQLVFSPAPPRSPSPLPTCSTLTSSAVALEPRPPRQSFLEAPLLSALCLPVFTAAQPRRPSLSPSPTTVSHIRRGHTSSPGTTLCARSARATSASKQAFVLFLLHKKLLH